MPHISWKEGAQKPNLVVVHYLALIFSPIDTKKFCQQAISISWIIFWHGITYINLYNKLWLHTVSHGVFRSINCLLPDSHTLSTRVVLRISHFKAKHLKPWRYSSQLILTISLLYHIISLITKAKYQVFEVMRIERISSSNFVYVPPTRNFSFFLLCTLYFAVLFFSQSWQSSLISLNLNSVWFPCSSWLSFKVTYLGGNEKIALLTAWDSHWLSLLCAAL